MRPPLEKSKAQGVDAQYRIHVHSKRKRCIDLDNIFFKYCIDQCVRSGLLPDDSYEYLKEINITQEKISSQDQEETLIFIYRKVAS